MKELLTQLAKYNIWANDKFISLLLKQDESLIDTEIVSSFSSIRKTVYHMWSAEDIWLQRLSLVEQPIWAESRFEGDFATACEKWSEASKGLLSFIERQYDDRALEHVLQYYNLKKQHMKLPVYVALTQVLNHGTYHRGQLITMLRQCGVKKVPSTDFFVFKGKQKK